MTSTTMAKRRAPVRSEKAEEQLCDDLVARIAGRDAVVRFSQARATMQTLGIPDRRYRVHGVAFWFEVKAEDGKLTTAQHAFLLAEIECGNVASCGTLDELIRLVEAARKGHAAAMGCAMAQLAHWVGRGYR
jgi:hypothetical protein